MTTGETAKGRSISELMTALPRKFWRTSISAHRTPKTVFSGTAMATQTSVIQNACCPSGLVIESSGSLIPFSKVLTEDHHQRDRQQQGEVAQGAGTACRSAGEATRLAHDGSSSARTG